MLFLYKFNTMKGIIFGIVLAVAFTSCSKSKIRTCTITLTDGTVLIKPSTKPLTRSEISDYEKSVTMWNGYKDAKCK